MVRLGHESKHEMTRVVIRGLVCIRAWDGCTMLERDRGLMYATGLVACLEGLPTCVEAWRLEDWSMDVWESLGDEGDYSDSIEWGMIEALARWLGVGISPHMLPWSRVTR